MKTINVSFEDREMEELVVKKGRMSWHDYIMTLAGEHQRIEKIRQMAQNYRLLPSERSEAIRILGDSGESAILALSEIGSDSRLLPSERSEARKQIKKILSMKKLKI